MSEKVLVSLAVVLVSIGPLVLGILVLAFRSAVHRAWLRRLDRAYPRERKPLRRRLAGADSATSGWFMVYWAAAIFVIIGGVGLIYLPWNLYEIWTK